MPLILPWSEIAIRLVCSVAAGAALGLNRTEHGRAAGLRTSILVCLAACVAMLQVNLLLSLSGRPTDSFVMNDLMRLPLGILSGIGFIGAGAIVRRDSFVVGVTTAATIWFLTVIGLCFGGGQISLGLIAVSLGFLVLTGLRRIEDQMKQDHQAKLVIVTSASGPDEPEIRSILAREGFRVSSCGFAAAQANENNELRCEVLWRAKPNDSRVPAFIRELARREHIVSIDWMPYAS